MMYSIELKPHHALQGRKEDDGSGFVTLTQVGSDTMQMAIVSKFTFLGLDRYVAKWTWSRLDVETPVWHQSKHWRLEKAIEAVYAGLNDLMEQQHED